MQTSVIHKPNTSSDKDRIRTLQKHAEPMTENGFTVSEELEILNIVERMRKGEEKSYSAEEAARYLGLDD